MYPETYKKVVITQIGEDPHTCLSIQETKLSEPKAHDILVKNHYAGVNSTDIGRMMGLNPHGKLPLDFGVEALGEVIAVGNRVEEFKVGDVVATALPGNGYREYTTIDRNFALKVPALDPKYVGLFISGAIAKIALDFVVDIQPNETVMVTSALGASGHFAVQLAKAQGCHVIGTCASAEEAAVLKQFNLDRIIIRDEEDTEQVLADEYHDMLNIVFDTMGGKLLDACIEHSAPRAKIIIAEALREHINHESVLHKIDFYHKVIRRSLSIIGFNLRDYANAIPSESLKLLDQMERGNLRSLVDPKNFSGIDSVPSAIAHLMGDHAQGKIVVKL